jgi:protein-tyrosine phosphatase
VSRVTSKESSLLKLLLVCTANVCRSPMAEAAARHRFGQRGLPVRVSSAGVSALAGEPAHPLSAAAVASAGYGDLSTHRSRLASSALLREADLVLCMEHEQRRRIVALAPLQAGRVRLLGHWQQVEIADPVSGALEGFEQCLALMHACLGQWIDRLARQGLLR